MFCAVHEDVIALQGLCTTSYAGESAASIVGVYPIEIESPIIKTVGAPVAAGRDSLAGQMPPLCFLEQAKRDKKRRAKRSALKNILTLFLL